MLLKKNIDKVVGLILCGVLYSENTSAESHLPMGSYATPSIIYVSPEDESGLDNSNGWAVALGYRKDFYAMEIVPSLVDLDGVDLASIAVNGLIFPLSGRGLYLTAGISASNYKDYVIGDDLEDFSTYNVDAGLGYIIALPYDEKKYAVRAEVKYRVSHREEEYNDADIDLDALNDYKQVVFSFGIQIPLGN